MQAYGYLMLGPTSFDGGGCSKANLAWSSPTSQSRRRFTAPASVSGNRNHYDVLGVSPNASSSDIKKAYRLLALKFHPDVNKEVGANEDFMTIRLAYDTLINETSRTEYDKTLHHRQRTRRPLGDDWTINQESEEELRYYYRWLYLRRKRRYERYWEQYNAREEQYDDADEVFDENPDEERGSFIEVLQSALLSIFLMQTVGAQLSLTFSSFMALIDQKLDQGYKFGYLFAWILGGRAGILLAMFLSFASWVCGKTSSSVVALVVFAMWFSSNLARYAPIPIPQGALLTLLYMSIKLRDGLS